MSAPNILTDHDRTVVWLGTPTKSAARPGVVRSTHYPPIARLALAVRLGAQGVLFALHLIAAEVTVDRHRAALSPRHCFALATPGALNPLRFNRHIPPFQTVTQVL